MLEKLVLCYVNVISWWGGCVLVFWQRWSHLTAQFQGSICVWQIRNKLTWKTKMHRKLSHSSQETWVKKVKMDWYFCINQMLLPCLEEELVSQCVAVPPGAPCNSNTFRQMHLNWSNSSQSTGLNNSNMCHKKM